MRFYLILTLCLIRLNAWSQTKIQGTVRDSQNTPLIQASVYLSLPDSSRVLAFGITDKNGKFLINVQNSSDSLQLYVSYLGFEKQQLNIPNIDQELKIQMKNSEGLLNEVLVKGKMEVSQRGDSIIYNVGDFKNQEDIFISDVLEKLPGIDVDDNGRVSYQGQYIQKYYIEGMDLLEGKYHIANSNMPANAVDEIQILENHQPVKLLDSLVYSDRASLNIKLKNNTQFIGVAELGIGLAPLLGEANITPMLFNKNQQLITSFQGNNTGNDVSRQLKTLTIENLVDEFEFNDDKEEFLSIQAVKPGGFEQRRWLNNSIYLGSVNHLLRLKNDYQLKTSFSYFKDSQEQSGDTFTQYFTSEDTINLTENKVNELLVENMSGMLTLEKNTKRIYLKNQLEVNRSWNEEVGLIARPSSEINQFLNQEHYSIQNKLRLTVPLGKNIVVFQSKMFQAQTPQLLNISPGPFEGLINDSLSYQNALQKVASKKSFSHNKISLAKSFGNVRLSGKVGHIFQSENLESQLYKIQNKSKSPLFGEFLNDLNYGQQSFYSIANIQYNRQKWNIDLNIPVSRKELKISVPKNAIVRWLIEPELSIHIKINPKLVLNSSAALNNKFGNIRRIYPGYLLINWRNIIQNQPEPFQALEQTYRAHLKYKNVLKSLFANLEYYHTNSTNNLIYSSLIQESGAILQQAFEADNFSQSNFLSTSISKFFYQIKSTITFGTEATWHQSEQLINKLKQKIDNYTYAMKLGFHTDFSKYLSVKYQGEADVLNTRVGIQNNSYISTQKHSLKASYLPTKKQSFSVLSDLYINDYSPVERTNLFFDVNYAYQINKKGLFLELHWINIFNNDSYTAVRANSFSYSSTTYQMRPTQFLAKVKFTF